MSEQQEDLKQVTIYTDGACIDNPGPGGYGAVLIYGTIQRELSGGYRLTTNNRMEIMAAIVALETLKFKCAVTLYSDSQLLVRGLSEGWAVKWRKKGWKRTGKKEAENADLWERLLAVYAQHEVEAIWVKGHAGNWGNERADQLSMETAKSADLQVDEAYEQGGTRIRPPSLFD